MRVSEAEARRYVEDVWEDVVADIATLVAVESVEDADHAVPDAPFGPAPAEALRSALEIAERLGLTPVNCDGYIGYGELKGASDTYLATICHADIVPLGEGWDTDPLTVTRREGYLLGRGVLDDKGPLVVSLWAHHFFAKHVKKTGEQLPYTLRAIVGSNEETNMADVDYYLEHFEEPAFCFSPDACFPLICGEKGLFQASVASAPIDGAKSLILDYTGGTVPNAVCGKATAVVRMSASELAGAERITVEDAGTDEAGCPRARITAQGVGGHAAMPEGTVNAIELLAAYLEGLEGLSAAERDFLAFQRRLCGNWSGAGLGCACEDEAFGPLTMVGGVVSTSVEAGTITFHQTIDSRYPTVTTGEALADMIASAAGEVGCSLEDWHHKKPFYISPDSPEISALMDAYHEVLGAGEPFTIGGGTYARRFRRAVAFGPDKPGMVHPAWVGPEHGANEGVPESSLKDALVVYILSIARLLELDL